VTRERGARRRRAAADARSCSDCIRDRARAERLANVVAGNALHLRTESTLNKIAEP